MRFARGLLLFTYGLFSIAAQALLFREFVTTFEGNDISVGIFFGSWFLWVGAGAVLVRRAEALAEALVRNIEFLLLAYLPAFVLQAALIISARQFVGVESYALWSIRDILIASAVVNAPISIITGLFFPVACRWTAGDKCEQSAGPAISYVYALEAAGSFIGGAGATVLLGLGVTSARIFLILALIVTISVFGVRMIRSRKWQWVLGPVCASVFLIAGVDTSLTRHVQIVKWRQLFGTGTPTGSFRTAQAEYLYGTYRDQWVTVREGSVVEALPDETSAGRIAATVLCQDPNAANVLVVGSGLGLCRQLLRLPQIEAVTWTHCDREYVRTIGRIVPAELKISDPRLRQLGEDIRSALVQGRERFDVVILNLPDATSSVLNRYYTLEFYHLIKQSLRPRGIVAVRIPGGENIMGTELVNIGASTKLTLARVFSKLVLVPGEDAWFIASDSQEITGEPGTLRDRFASIEGADRILTPEALLSVYLPDRAASALSSYADADLPEKFLVNRDSRPLTHLYSLLLAAKQSGAPAAQLVKHLVPAGPLPLLIPVLIYVILRSLYIWKSPRQGEPSGFDSSFLVFSAGAVGIGAVIVLMHLYQMRFGSLYLHIGIVSSLFMAGATVGAAATGRLSLSRVAARTHTLLFATVILNSLILCVIALLTEESWSHPVFAAAFTACGVCLGCYFPIAARQMADCGIKTGRIGSRLEAADHLGAAAGGAVTSLALIPILGAGATMFGFAILVMANAVPAAVRVARREEALKLDRGPLGTRSVGYWLFGISASVILCSNLLADVGARLQPSLPRRSVLALAGGSKVVPKSAVAAYGSRITYFDVLDANDNLTGYIFSSQDLAPKIRGFGGKINLAIHVRNPDGELMGFHVARSNETPAYIDLLESWRDSLIGRDLFAAGLADVDTVSGATISSKAILSALQTSGRNFATQVLGHSSDQAGEQVHLRARYLPDRHGTYLIAAVVLALIATFKGGFWSRLLVLSLSLAAGGVWLNAQYSAEQIMTALCQQPPALALSGAFLFVVGVPLLVAIFGNIYCGYICPFGAAQELVACIVPKRLKPKLSVETLRQARFVKYIVLCVLIVVFFASRDRTTLAADPLISVFNLQFSIVDSVTLIAAGALVASLFCTRFWCRYLCPAGAFLSLLSSVAVLRRYMPAKKFGKCEFGLTARDNMDCIYCDKCRYEHFTRPRFERKEVATAFLILVAVAAILVSAVSTDRFLAVMGTDLDAGIVSASGGQPRDVDLQRVNKMIDQKRLSDKEADYYRKVE